MILRFAVLLALVFAFDAAMLIYFFSNPSPGKAPLLVAAGVGMIPVIAMLAFHMLWRPIFAKYPAQRPTLDAVSRRYQSFSVGIVNMGFSINVSTDEEFLHLDPLWLWQVLGATPASVPWTALSPATHSAMVIGLGRVVRLDGHTIAGPRWCFERVFDAGESQTVDD